MSRYRHYPDRKDWLRSTRRACQEARENLIRLRERVTTESDRSLQILKELRAKRQNTK